MIDTISSLLKQTGAIAHRLKLRQQVTQNDASELLASWVRHRQRRDSLRSHRERHANATKQLLQFQRRLIGVCNLADTLGERARTLLGDGLNLHGGDGIDRFDAAIAEAHAVVEATRQALGRRNYKQGPSAIHELADLFFHLTGQKPKRRIQGPDHTDKGKEYGPFWVFAVAMWKLAYGETKGLSNQSKKLAEHLRRRKLAADTYIVSTQWVCSMIRSKVMEKI